MKKNLKCTKLLAIIKTRTMKQYVFFHNLTPLFQQNIKIWFKLLCLERPTVDVGFDMAPFEPHSVANIKRHHFVWENHLFMIYWLTIETWYKNTLYKIGDVLLFSINIYLLVSILFSFLHLPKTLYTYATIFSSPRSTSDRRFLIRSLTIQRWGLLNRANPCSCPTKKKS